LSRLGCEGCERGCTNQSKLATVYLYIICLSSSMYVGSGFGGYHTTLAFPIEIDRDALREGTPQRISIGMFFGM